MALLDRFRGPAPAPPSQVEPRPAITIHSVTDTSLPQVEPDSPITVHVIEDTNTFEGHDGEIIWGGGYAPVDEDGLFLYEADHETSDPRAFYCKIAGAQHRPKALADKRRFAVGSRIVLRPEPDNPYDPNAVGIWDASGEVQVGYVPATLSAE